MRFQSTHSRGVRQGYTRVASSLQRFQSTHSRGVRLLRDMPCVPRPPVSIHALAGSATAIVPDYEPNLSVSIHALAGSATSKAEAGIVASEVSIHALAGSAT